MKQIPCPICKKPTPYEGNPFRPFCSKRCKTMDLGAWASEEYRVASQEESLSKETSDEESEI